MNTHIGADGPRGPVSCDWLLAKFNVHDESVPAGTWGSPYIGGSDRPLTHEERLYVSVLLTHIARTRYPHSPVPAHHQILSPTSKRTRSCARLC